MSKQISKFWWRWLIVVTDGVVLFSLALMLLPDTMLRFFNWLFFGINEGRSLFGTMEGDYLVFVYSILGAVMIGWATTLFFVIMGPFKRGEREGWNALAVSLTVWFVIDSFFSVLTGFAANVVVNILFYILYVVPLGATYKEFFGRQQEEIVSPQTSTH